MKQGKDITLYLTRTGGAHVHSLFQHADRIILPPDHNNMISVGGTWLVNDEAGALHQVTVVPYRQATPLERLAYQRARLADAARRFLRTGRRHK